MHAPSGVLFRLFDADRVLPRALGRGARRFVTAWVRGLGDVPYILAEFARYLRGHAPEAELSFLVRPGLEEACRWIEGVRDVIVVPEWTRARTADSLWGLAYPPPWEIRRVLNRRELAPRFDAVVPYPLGRWFERTAADRRPTLAWTEAERRFGREFIDRAFPERPRFVIALNTHIGTGRYYPFDKEWGIASFAVLMRRILDTLPESRLILVDAEKVDGLPAGPRVLDARGTLAVPQSISVIANADLFVGLDAGPANLVYFLKGVSLDAIVLLGRTSCFMPLVCPPASAGMRLHPLRGAAEDIHAIAPDTVLAAVHAVRERRHSPGA